MTDDNQATMAEIKSLIEYQGKLIEEMYHTLDALQKQKEKSMPDVAAIMNLIGANPFIKSNPHIQDMIKNLFPGRGDIRDKSKPRPTSTGIVQTEQIKAG